MDTVIVQLPTDTDGVPDLLHLSGGQSVSFGRGAPAAAVDVVIPDDEVSRVAGEILAVEDHWRLSNYSSAATYVVENPEGAGEYIKVPPRRLAAPVPFEFARIVLPTSGGFAGLKVFAPQHAYLDPSAKPFVSGEGTTAPFPLDVEAKYFLVLVALCEPRLRDVSAVAIPTVPEVIERLRPLSSCRDLTRSAVNYHIDYLAVTKLKVKQPSLEGGERLDWKREALVDLALRFDLVREDHLALLPALPASPAERQRRAAGPGAGEG